MWRHKVIVNQQGVAAYLMHPSFRFSFIHYLSFLVIFTFVTSRVNEQWDQEAERRLFCK